MDLKYLLIKEFHTGFDIGNTFFGAVHAETDMLARFDHDSLRCLVPRYFIEILEQNLCVKYNQASIDPDQMFRFMGIRFVEGPFEKLIIYHVDYPLYKDPGMYFEMDLSLFVQQHNRPPQL